MYFPFLVKVVPTCSSMVFLCLSVVKAGCSSIFFVLFTGGFQEFAMILDIDIPKEESTDHSG